MIPNTDWRVLVIEDEVDSMELVQEVLAHSGIQSVGAVNAQDGLQMLDDLNPTLIIVDLNLPGIDGWGFLKRVRRDFSAVHAPCVAITAYHSLELAEKAVSAGFAAYFPKPLDAASFVRDLNTVVNHS